MVRLTSVIWFGVFMRRESERGAFVAVAKKGAQQAGALYVLHDHMDGTCCLYAPAPQALVDTSLDDDRRFERVMENRPREDVTDYLDKQVRFDPDLWIIETEGGSGLPSLAIVDAEL